MPQQLVLQLAHISDIHFVTPPSRVAAKTRRLPWLPPRLAAGLMGHSQRALVAFEKSIQNILPDDDTRARTWLVVTGDLTTLGEQSSLDEVVDWVRSLAQTVGVSYAILYGNHDVWNGGLPLFTSQNVLYQHRSELRSRIFTGDWPLAPMAEGAGQCGSAGAAPAIEATLPVGRQLVVTSLNTVIHDQLLNTLAFGKVAQDRYWESGSNLPPQLDALRAKARQDEVRVVLTHHPVHDPAVCSATGQPFQRLLNAGDVAQALERPVGGSALATLVVSGHTHAGFPDSGHLPDHLPRSLDCHDPLGDGQAQLIASTLSQRPFRGKGHEHEWQCLSFWDDAGQLVLERVIYQRPGRVGDFQRVEDSSGNFAERMVLS
jgi:3',5'-cyclic AMP phosphodiesterase CpdA